MPKASIDFLYDLSSNIQKEFNNEFKKQSQLLLGLSSGILTLLLSQNKNLPESNLFFYIYLVLWLSILTGVGVQYFYVKFIKSQNRKVKKAIHDIEKSIPENQSLIYNQLRKEIYNHPSVVWLNKCSSFQSLLFLIGFILIAKILIFP